MSLHIVPPASHATSIAPAGPAKGAPSSRAVPDTLRHGRSGAGDVNGGHPLEQRLKAWDATQHALKMESLRRQFGAAEPIRREMELRLAGADYRPAQLGGGTNVHYDILMGTDETITWEDVFKGNDNVWELPDFHTELEQRCNMNWS